MKPCKDHGYSCKGYANTTRGGEKVALHRLVYCQSAGVSLSSITGLVVRHSCDNARCIEPTHLLLGTQADNMADRVLRYKPTKRRLDQAIIDEVTRRGRAGEPQTKLAAEFKLSAATVNRYVNGADRRK